MFAASSIFNSQMEAFKESKNEYDVRDLVRIRDRTHDCSLGR